MPGGIGSWQRHRNNARVAANKPREVQQGPVARTLLKATDRVQSRPIGRQISTSGLPRTRAAPQKRRETSKSPESNWRWEGPFHDFPVNRQIERDFVPIAALDSCVKFRVNLCLIEHVLAARGFILGRSGVRNERTIDLVLGRSGVVLGRSASQNSGIRSHLSGCA
jgi:hypothetical protein